MSAEVFYCLLGFGFGFLIAFVIAIIMADRPFARHVDDGPIDYICGNLIAYKVNGIWVIEDLKKEKKDSEELSGDAT